MRRRDPRWAAAEPWGPGRQEVMGMWQLGRNLEPGTPVPSLLATCEHLASGHSARSTGDQAEAEDLAPLSWPACLLWEWGPSP